MLDEFENSRKKRDDDDEIHDEREMFLDDGNVPEIITRERQRAHPEDPARDIVRREFHIRHAAHPGHERREGPDDRHETRDDDRFSAVLLEKLFRFL